MSQLDKLPKELHCELDKFRFSNERVHFEFRDNRDDLIQDCAFLSTSFGSQKYTITKFNRAIIDSAKDFAVVHAKTFDVVFECNAGDTDLKVKKYDLLDNELAKILIFCYKLTRGEPFLVKTTNGIYYIDKMTTTVKSNKIYFLYSFIIFLALGLTYKYFRN